MPHNALAPIAIGCAGWSLRAPDKTNFPDTGSHLERYAAVLPAVEVNSSFYRSHRGATWARWADSTPEHFRFSVKLPRTITHELRLVGSDALLDSFLSEAGQLQDKLGPILIQLPPTLRFDSAIADHFLDGFRQRHAGPLVCEPRHPTWFTADADALLKKYRIALAAVDPPAKGQTPLTPGGASDVLYFRLHGSPKIYYSNYDGEFLKALAERLMRLRGNAASIWCIFDNTAEGHAIPNALTLLEETTQR